VHVALWQRSHGITDAAVAQPALDAVYASDPAPRTGPAEHDDLIFLVSDSRPPVWAQPLADALNASVQPMGSAGAKAMAVVAGEVDVYLHSGGQHVWDSAAPVAVARAAGLHASRIDGSDLVYGAATTWLPDVLVCRPELRERVLEALAA
jgi:3'-phosphoadenosine 5'-phosphosulfate (PAPS) 3'-phosphatase